MPLTVFSALAVVVTRGDVGWDQEMVRLSERHYEASIAEPLELALKIGIGVGAVLAAAAVLTLLKRRRRLFAAFWIIAVGGIVLFELPLKALFHRPPIGDEGGGYSFPSGNAMATVAIVAALVITSPAPWRRRAIVVGVPFVLAYGSALVYQYWHYPSDVLAGWCIAVAWVVAVWIGFRVVNPGWPTRTRLPARGESGRSCSSLRLEYRGGPTRPRPLDRGVSRRFRRSRS